MRWSRASAAPLPWTKVQIDLRDFAAAIDDYSASLTPRADQALVLYNRSLPPARAGQLKESSEHRRRAPALDPPVTGDEDRARRK